MDRTYLPVQRGCTQESFLDYQQILFNFDVLFHFYFYLKENEVCFSAAGDTDFSYICIKKVFFKMKTISWKIPREELNTLMGHTISLWI